MKEVGFCFIESMPKFAKAAPGTLEPDNWMPYKLWSGDLWACEGCGHEIISGTGRLPIAEHYQTDFAATVERLNASRLHVNDC
jgi:hypothetical protein